MVNLKYKIVYGFEADNYLPIDADELEKAQYAHMTQSRAIFKAGSGDFTKSGIFIQPDFNAAMGWTRGYKLTADDYVEIERNGVDTAHREYFEKIKERVEYLKATGKTDLIGKNVPIPELDKPTTERKDERGGGMKRIELLQ